MNKNIDSTRIIFLKLFTKEILLNLYQKDKSLHNIETEKVKQRIFGKEEISENNFINLLSTSDSQIEINNDARMISSEMNQELNEKKRISMIRRENVPIKIPPYPIIKPQNRKQIPRIQKTDNFQGMEKSMDWSPNSSNNNDNQQKINANMQNPKQVQTNAMPAIDKISPLMKDNTIVTIECSGPGKNLIVKRYNQINTTKITLSEEEIKSIVNYFSKEARIPLAGGILKAAVGNSIISAVLSDFVGSRFIINKMTPYSLLAQK